MATLTPWLAKRRAVAAPRPEAPGDDGRNVGIELHGFSLKMTDRRYWPVNLGCACPGMPLALRGCRPNAKRQRNCASHAPGPARAGFKAGQGRIFRQRHGQRRIGRNPAGHRQRRRQGLAISRHFGDDANVACLAGVHEIAGQQQRHGLGLADGVNQALGAAGTGNGAQLDFRHAELGGLASNHDVAGQRQFHAAAQRDLFHRRDDGLGKRPSAAKVPARCRAVAQQRRGTQHFKGRDVGARAKHVLGAGDDDGSHGIVVAQLRKLRAQAIEYRAVQAVLRTRAVDGQGDDGAVTAHEHFTGFAHGGPAHASRSMMVVLAVPEASQMVCRP